MEEKEQLLHSTQSPPRVRETDAFVKTPGRERTRRRLLTATLLVLTLWLLFHNTPSLLRRHCAHHDEDWVIVDKDVAKVPLEAHIMSKCPDAQACLQKLVVPTMEMVHDKVDFKLSFIGSVDKGSDAVSCMHGPAECLGNMIILCATKLYPDPKSYLGFANCMISDYSDIPQRDLVEGCAMEHGLDFEKINRCISDEGEGMDLLRSSVERSADHNVTKSCTVRLDGEIRCIRDGGEWYDCESGSSVSSLVEDVGDLYKKLNN